MQKFFRKKPVKDLLPVQPIDGVLIEHWWKVHVGYITEEDIRLCTIPERKTIDRIIDQGAQVAGDLSYTVIHGQFIELGF